MEFPKQIKDIVYKLLQEPTLDKFRDFLKAQTGEHNSIDFKGEWIRKGKLAKEILAIANSGGGIIVFGVAENEDKTFHYTGLPEIIDKAQIFNETKHLLPSTIKYEIYDFSYSDSEYNVLKDKKYQMVVVEDTPEFLPFISEKESDGIKENSIYIRKGTTCQLASKEDIEHMITRRINHMYPNNGLPLDLSEHLQQLKELYENINETTYKANPASVKGITQVMLGLTSFLGEQTVEVPNSLYPDESYDEFVSRMITEKKNKIVRILDLH